ncbi:hypothetical protein CFP56_029303 [Quercus suber]|uniref:Uncharacterized protein n=1 Tax=Quercus suber TaxID=58331 RepID=A0AAW0MAF4_QUESU
MIMGTEPLLSRQSFLRNLNLQKLIDHILNLVGAARCELAWKRGALAVETLSAFKDLCQRIFLSFKLTGLRRQNPL